MGPASPVAVPAVAARAEATSRALYRGALWVLLAAKVLAGWGVQWDIQWHLRIGRDSFWIPPHVMTYAGVAVTVLVSFGVLARDTWRRRAGRPPDGTVRWLGLTGTRGFHLAAWGIALTVLAAPVDDLWHRLFGLDVTLWSPPHLLGLLGGLVNTLACFLIAAEVHPARSGWRWSATVLAAASLHGLLGFVLQPAFRMAYLHGGVAFHLYAILAALLLPAALLTPARLLASRAATVAVAALVLALGLAGNAIARIGFDLLQPVSFVAEEIAKDPTSPIAVAHEMARRGGTGPGIPALAVRVLYLLPVLLLAGLDPRRRPLPSALAWAVGLFAVSALIMARAPAYRDVVPGLGATAAGLALTLLAGGLGARLAVWLAAALSAGDRPAGA